MRVVDEEGNPIEGAFAGAWWNDRYAGVFTEGAASDKDGKSTLYMYPNQRQYVAAGDWRERYWPAGAGSGPDQGPTLSPSPGGGGGSGGPGPLPDSTGASGTITQATR